MTTQFDISALGLTVTEGGVYSFTLTPKVALGSDTVIRWEIVPKGELPISSSDFSALSGVVNFASGATDAQTVTLTPSDDSVLEVLKHFELRVYEVVGDRDDTTTETDDILIGSQDVTLSDDETDDYGSSRLSSTGEANILTAANTQDLTTSGGGGDDIYIITRFQHGDVSISDTFGTNLVKFDAGVTITDYSETSVSFFGNVSILSVSLTLSTGAEVMIDAPLSFSFQLGDGETLSYADFKTAIGASGTNATSALAADYAVTTQTSVPDISGNTEDAPTQRLVSTGEADVLGAGGDFSFTASGGGGDDTYIITRFQHGDVSISDTFGTNLVKFDAGVTITDYSETSVSFFGNVSILSVSLTLSTGAEVMIDAPLPFSFQLGDGEVLSYAAFKTAIGASGTAGTSTLAADYTVTAPQVPTEEPEANNAPVVATAIADQTATEGTAFSLDISSVFTDADGDTLTYSISGNPSWLSFDADTGVFSGTPAQSDTGTYTVTVTATDPEGESVTDTFDITVENIDNNAPVVTASGDFFVTPEEKDYVVNIHGLIFTAEQAPEEGETLSIRMGYATNTPSANARFDAGTGVLTISPHGEGGGGPGITNWAGAYTLNEIIAWVRQFTDFTDNFMVELEEGVDGDTVVLDFDGSGTGYSYPTDSYTVHVVENQTFNLVAVDADPVVQVDENIAANTVVFTATATDADNIAGETPTETITYELVAGMGDNAFFRIDETTGEVRFLARPDYETQASYVVHVKAISTSTLGTGSMKETTAQYTVNLNDLNDTPPVITTTQTDYSVDENADAVVVQLTADKAVNWEILNNAGDGGLFEIDADGNLSFVSAPDYELARDEDGDNVYTVQVRALDSTNTALRSTVDITVRVNNVDDNAPVDATEGGGTIHTVEVAGIEFTYLGNDIPTGFALRFIPDYSYIIDPKTSRVSGELTTLVIHYNEDDVTTLQQLVDLINKDFTGRILNGELVIDNRDDDEPIISARLVDPSTGSTIFDASGNHQFTEGVAPFTVSEDVGTTGVVFTAKATDADNVEGQTATDTITYVLGSGDGDNSYFTIDTNTGEVRFKAEPDYDTKSSYQVHVLAVSSSSLGVGGGSTQSTLIKYQVDLTEAAEPNTAPTLTSTIADQTAVEGSLFTLDVSGYFADADGDTLTYTATLRSSGSVTEPLPSWLSIDADTGIISGTPPANTPNIVVAITASDGRGGEVFTSFNMVTEEDTGENHVPHGRVVVDVLPAYASGISEHVDTSTDRVKLATVSGVTDDDDNINYVAKGADAGLIEILKEDDGSYAVYLKQGVALDYETERLLTFRVVVEAEEGEVETIYDLAVSSGTINIQVLNENDAPTLHRPIDDVILAEGEVFEFKIDANHFDDVDEIDTLTYTAEFIDADGNVITTPSWLTLVHNLASIDFLGTAPTGDDAGDYTVRVTASDGRGGVVSDDFTISVDGAPVFDIENEQGKTTQGIDGSVVEIQGIRFIYTGDVESFEVTVSRFDSTSSILDISGNTTNGIKIVASSVFGARTPTTLQHIVDLINTGNTTAVDYSGPSFPAGYRNRSDTDLYGANPLIRAELVDPTTGSTRFDVAQIASEEFAPVTYQFESSGSGLSVNDPITWAENTATTEIVFTASATDPNAADTIVYSFDDSGADNDHSFFTIDAATGAVRFAATPDYETQTSYVVYVKATSTNPEGDALESTIKYTVELTDVAETSPAPPVQPVQPVLPDPVGESIDPAPDTPDIL